MPNKIRKAKKKSGFSLKNLGVADWTVIAILIVFVLFPDPLDILTFGLPLLEGLITLIFLIIRTKNNLRN